jgi:hypothetical protein
MVAVNDNPLDQLSKRERRDHEAWMACSDDDEFELKFTPLGALVPTAAAHRLDCADPCSDGALPRNATVD